MATQICTDARFVEVWQQAENVEAVAAETGLKATSCQSRASSLRKLGVDLKKMNKTGRKGSQKNVEALQALAEKFAPNSGEESEPEPSEPSEIVASENVQETTETVASE